ncbi:MAG: calcium-translocating P-type ATPase, PMCA-type [Oscillospiraceae bacterium]|nr:calcium-translocating P-type ATPase, PMCA-type [Oscillospiraceae bacterium]
MDWYTKTVGETLGALGTDGARGLSLGDALGRLQQYGPNRLEGKRPRRLIQKFAEQLSDFMVLILIAAAGLSLVISLLERASDFLDSIIIMAIVFLNATMGVIQEARAERAIESLQKLSAPKSRVLREGAERVIDSTSLVPGDILILETGDAVTADARIVEGVSLRVEESSLTGESVPVDKEARARVRAGAPLGERRNMLFAGSALVAGRCRAVVTETGMHTQVGQIASLLDSAAPPETPLQRRLGSAGRTMGVFALLICAGIFLLGVIQRTPIIDSFMLAVSLAVAAVPEGLPAIVTIVLALGVQRMARRNAIVRKLPAVETLGSATVICSDKTGTLTENKMTVQMTAPASGRQSDGQRLLLYGALCTNTRLTADGPIGDPTEAAIVTAALGAGLDIKRERTRHPRKGELPFDSARKRMSTLHRAPEGDLLIVKGAPDVLLGFCDRADTAAGPEILTAGRRRGILAQNAEMAAKALRVIAVAHKPMAPLNGTFDEGAEGALIFLGLIAMQDPPRPEAKEAVRTCRRAGIRPVMITGDHAETAAAIAKELGILTGNRSVCTGQELDHLSDRELRKIVKTTAVFARVSPAHKSRVVEAFQANGEIVAMTGDGVNDAPALKIADIGCAMGKTGTDVARDASDMILTDDNFATIVAAVKAGRGIYQNMVKSVHFLLSCNVGEILTVLIAILIGMPPPLLPIQLLWVNLVTDAAPALALGAEKTDRDIMERPPVNPKAGMFTGGLALDILLQGMIIGGLALWAFFLGLRAGDETTGRTYAFAVLALSQLFHAFNVRSRESLFRVGVFSNSKMVLAFLFCTCMQIVVIGHPVLAEIFGVVPLTLPQWRTVAMMAPIPLIVMELTKFFRSRNKAEPVPLWANRGGQMRS